MIVYISIFLIVFIFIITSICIFIVYDNKSKKSTKVKPVELPPIMPIEEVIYKSDEPKLKGITEMNPFKKKAEVNIIPASAVFYKYNEPGGKWICSNCETENSLSNLYCSVCKKKM